MQKVYLLCLLCFFGAVAGKAQLSKGGTPYSFGSDFRATDLAKMPLPTFAVPALDLPTLQREDAETVNADRFAAATAVSLQPNTHGLWQDLPTGEQMWRVQINLQGQVTGMRLLFDKFRLPEGGRLFIYSPDHQILLGAFTAHNNKPHLSFATTLLKNKTIILEYTVPAGKAHETLLHIHRIDQAYRTVGDMEKKGDKVGFGNSGSCNLDINCTTLANDWQEEKRCVVRIITVNGGGSSYCSGSLIGNTAQDRKPYILTAYHCRKGVSVSFLDFWTFDFNYEISDCNAPNAEPANTQNLTGATLKSEYLPSDFCLLELQDAVPNTFNAYWNSWNRLGQNVSGAVCIHHPSGDVKKFTRDTDMNSTTSYYDEQPNDNTHYRQVWNNGTTEGGSSGSPLFDSAGNIIGQLHGGEALCSAPNDPDWFGKVSASWVGGGTVETRLSDWLDPIGSGAFVLTSVQREKIQNPFKLYPNPAQKDLQLAYENSAWAGQTIEVRLYDQVGKLAYQTKQTLPTNTASKPLRLPALPVGLYVVQIVAQQGIFTQTLVVE
ncbi:MAG: T9SS C-terminal target domain-containing protein [Bacteroidetes bacterium]|nr:MAG: T9SS C-terminal target domain-containing protein [Bacteroidota bacterium]